ncbi:hypothetical protein [Mesorhizobium sp.]|uniref:hypothetical protein n=1 Tax=Mesorhizobium sp. TaxID=1871066 RepID=UPI0025BF68E6|nr:hypothetical protein [Mesorhizobium sp.]
MENTYQVLCDALPKARAGFDRAARLADIAAKIEKNRGNGQIAGTPTRAAGN